MRKKQKDFEIISAYIDGELSDTGKAEVEKLILESEEFRKEFKALKRIKQLTSQIGRLPESPYLESKIIAELERKQGGYKRIRKWVPAIALVSVTLLVMIVLKINPDIVSEIWEEQKTTLAGFYKENLQPVLFAADLTNEDIFNFAFNNELPLNNSRDQYLHIGYDDAGKEYFEIRPVREPVKESGYGKFVNALKLDEKEKQLVDSIIGSYAQELESQVLVNDKNTLAINPKLWNYRKAIFADLITVAQNFNKTGAAKFIPGGLSEDDRIRVVNALNKFKTVPENQYIFCTSDSVFPEVYEFRPQEPDVDIKILKRKLGDQKKLLKQINYEIRFDSAWKNLNEDKKIKSLFRIEVDSNICRVDLSEFRIPEINIPDFDSINNLIEEATRNFQFHAYNIPKIEHFDQGVKFDYFEGDSVHSFEFRFEDINIDSVIKAGRDRHESWLNGNQMWLKWFDDSALSKYQFDNDYFLRYYDAETMREQVKELQEELEKLREEMKNWKLPEKRERSIKIN